MSLRFEIAAMLFLMVQAVLFGVGAVLVLGTSLADHALVLMPWAVGIAAVIAAPVSWMIAPRLRARYWRDHSEDHGFFGHHAKM
jgi:4-amino-4-deoxy-L-arabinose transferase-like glycosyltransferase